MPNKCIVVAATAALPLLGFAAGAQADGRGDPADVAYSLPVPPPPPPSRWAGFFIGGNVGGVWTTDTLTDQWTGTSFDTDRSAFIGGVQLGYNFQVRNLVFGIEGDFNWASMSESGDHVDVPAVGTLQASLDTDWVTTLAARVGLTLDRWLVFFQAGGGWVHSSATLTNLTTGDVVGRRDTRGGWLLGAGVEYALANHWTAKVEYEFLDLSEQRASGLLGNTFTFERDLQMLKVGLSYRF